ncbi:MAG: DNA cytosine methyltransferase [Burkholderiales bacterium]|nr:MAG: DNA cytosine methyltransferase [Burkholderiales bacterium]
MLQHYILRSVGLHRNAPRVYLDDGFLNATAFQPGTLYNVHVEESGCRIVLKVSETGSRKVSSKDKRGRRQPVIDINSRTDLAGFDGQQLVRIVITHAEVYILIPASERNRRERLRRLLAKFNEGQDLRMASFAHGIGVMSNAAHAGLTKAGVNATLAIANELESIFIGQSMQFNDAWSANTHALAAPMQEVVQDQWLMNRLGTVEIMEAGIPCSGASKAGKAKRGLHHMESHPTVGHLIAPVVMAIQHLQPVAVCIENVESYSTSASADILRKMLNDMLYAVHEIVLDARPFGTTEGRTRWFLVAVTQGIEIDLQVLLNTAPEPAPTVAEQLDDIALDAPAWRSFTYLIKKEERDASKGNCFAMQIVKSSDCSVPTLRKGYHKGGSTDPLLEHPTREGLYRLFTPAEHARFKGIPASLIAGMSSVQAHQGLGQSISYPVVSAIFELLGRSLSALRQQDVEVKQAASPSYNLVATG